MAGHVVLGFHTAYQECSGLSHVPQAVKIMKLELCHLSRSADEELEALKVWLWCCGQVRLNSLRCS